MLSNENSTEILKLIERSKHTNAGLGGYIVYMIVLLAILVADTVYYEMHTWYDVDYDIYTELLQFVIFFYATVYLFRGTEGHRIIYGWRRWVLGCVFAVWTLFLHLQHGCLWNRPAKKYTAKQDTPEQRCENSGKVIWMRDILKKTFRLT